MGWLYSFEWQHRTDIVKHLTATGRSEKMPLEWLKSKGVEVVPDETDESYRSERTTVKHCYRGGMRSGTLWAVVDYKIIRKSTGDVCFSDRYILCCLLKWGGQDYGWGYKGMDESSGPYVDSCPLSYLEMTPIPKNLDGTPQQYAAEFRKRIYDAAEKKKAARANRYKPLLGEKVRLHDDALIKYPGGKYKPVWVQILSQKPLVGVADNGVHVNLSAKYIAGKYEEPASTPV